MGFNLNLLKHLLKIISILSLLFHKFLFKLTQRLPVTGPLCVCVRAAAVAVVVHLRRASEAALASPLSIFLPLRSDQRGCRGRLSALFSVST